MDDSENFRQKHRLLGIHFKPYWFSERKMLVKNGNKKITKFLRRRIGQISFAGVRGRYVLLH